MAKAKKPKTYVAVVLDRSGSMDSIRAQTVKAFNDIVRTVRDRADEQEVAVTLVTFSNRSRFEFLNADPRTLKELTVDDFRCDGMTALLDAVGETTEKLKDVKDADDDNVSFLVLVVTDGDENMSSRFRQPGKLADLMRECQATDRWSFAFNVPPGRKDSFVRQFGIPSDNVREWEGNARGMEETSRATTTGLSNYFAARSKGTRSVASFYVTADMSKVKAKDVKAKLDDISDRFKPFTVDRETPIREFVEKKTGKEYVIGSTFYQLTKTEKVQPQKNVLVQEKGKAAVWGGAEARDLIGLPRGVEAKVTPGNLAAFDVFVQSTSPNRLLVRGTRVLVDTKKKKGDKPTWDFEAAEAAAAAKA
jgi:hypothetical protein